MKKQMWFRLALSSLLLSVLLASSTSAASSKPSATSAPPSSSAKPYQLPSDKYLDFPKYRNDRGETLKFRGNDKFKVNWIKSLKSPVSIAINKEGDRVYVTDDRLIISLDLNGVEQWRYNLPSRWFNYYLLQTGVDGTLYAIDPGDTYDKVPGSVYALNASGKLLWSYTFDDSSSLGWHFAGGANATFIAYTSDQVMGIRDGQVAWKNSEFVRNVPMKMGNYSYSTINIKNLLSGRDGYSYVQTNDKLYALDDAGKVLWSKSYDSNKTPVLIQDGLYLLNVANDQWTLWDSSNGSAVTGVPLDPAWLQGTDIPNDGQGGVYVSNSKGGIVKLDRNGKLSWSYKIRFAGYSDAYGLVSDGQGNVYFTDTGGTFYSLDRNGNERFMMVYRNEYGPGSTYSVIGKDGGVYALFGKIGLFKFTSRT